MLIFQVEMADGTEKPHSRDELWLPTEELPKQVKSRLVSTKTHFRLMFFFMPLPIRHQGHLPLSVGPSVHIFRQ